MKSRKFFISSALALSTVLGSVGTMMNAMPISATAVTVSGFEEGHTFTAYQVFKGTLVGDKIADIKWGDNVNVDNQAAIIAALKGVADTSPLAPIKAKLTEETPKADIIANAISELGLDEDSEGARELAKIFAENVSGTGTVISQETTNLGYGYYLIKDTTNNLDDYDVYGLSILQVHNNTPIDIKPKNAKPKVDKSIYDNDDHDGPDGSNVIGAGWGETADYAIGESFQCKLTATINQYSDIKAYETYKLVLNDEWSAGIDYDTAVTPKVELVINGDYEHPKTITNAVVGTPDSERKMTVTIADLKQHLTDPQDKDKIEVVVTYNAKLNANAAVGNGFDAENKQNNNKVYLEYSNNPNAEGTGTTTEDHVYVFTYTLENTKVNNLGESLGGAGFKLYKEAQGDNPAAYATFDSDNKFAGWVDSIDKATEIESSEATGTLGQFTMTGLDAGTYVLTETKVPEGYSPAADTRFTITAEHKENSDAKAVAVIKIDNDESKKGITVVNSKASNLPETGGMGTTIFYAAGGILAAGAVIALAATKKAKKEED